jgi:hypothetical protein
VADRHLTITGRVVGVDPGAHTLSIKAARGRARRFEVRDPLGRKVLESISLGDSLTVVFAEAAAVAITPVPKG